MSEEITRLFLNYAGVAAGRLTGPMKDRATLKRTESGYEIRRLVDQAESSVEFQELVSKTKTAFERPTCSFWCECEGKTRNFFRRTGFYLRALDGEDVDVPALAQMYLTAFERSQVRRTYLAPIECAVFNVTSVGLRNFEIRKFTEQELQTLLTSDVNAVFYEYAAIETNDLADYWFIRAEEQVPLLDELEKPVVDGPEIRFDYTSLPRPIEHAVQALALYDWRHHMLEGYPDSDRGKGWFRFNLPFVLVLDDNLLGVPSRAPDLSVLSKEVRVIEIDDGHEIEIEEPERGATEYETTSFESFFARVGPPLETARRLHGTWPFIEIALGYFVKAFLSEGPEQLLWHITVLDALLGRKVSKYEDDRSAY